MECEVTGASSVGGLVGMNRAEMENCRADGTARGAYAVGVLCGQNISGHIAQSYATGSSDGGDYVGVLIGYNNGDISRCWASGTSAASGNCAGVLCGVNRADVVDCYAVGSVSGNMAVGGLSGTHSDEGEIRMCYASAAVHGNGVCGGLIGSNPDGPLTSCFWNIEICPDLNGIGDSFDSDVAGKTTAEMRLRSTFELAGWDFNDTWDICEDLRYPTLTWQQPPNNMTCLDGLDFLDYAFFADHWLWVDYGDLMGMELTHDGAIDARDFAVFANWWGEMSCGDCGGVDFTGEGDVDIDDLAVLCGYWLSTDYGNCEGAELTGDGLVDIADLKALTNQWLEGI